MKKWNDNKKRNKQIVKKITIRLRLNQIKFSCIIVINKINEFINPELLIRLETDQFRTRYTYLQIVIPVIGICDG